MGRPYQHRERRITAQGPALECNHCGVFHPLTAAYWYGMNRKPYCKRHHRELTQSQPAKARRVAYTRELAEARSARGLCIECGQRPAQSGRNRCPECRAAAQQRERASRARRRAAATRLKQ